jgi:signal transduction histidine kinase
MRYLAFLLISMVIPLVFTVGCLYYLIFNVMAEQVGIPEYIASNIFPVIDKINTILIIGVPPLFVILILWGIVLSHRLAGPMERLESEIKKISQGNHTHRIKVRKNDDIRPIADAINALLDSMEERKR